MQVSVSSDTAMVASSPTEIALLAMSHDEYMNPVQLAYFQARLRDMREACLSAWMNRAALRETLATRHVCYWSRSRARLWRKGETSGHAQHLREMRLGCDGDAPLLLVEQTGPACHTGRASCFYNAVRGDRVQVISSALQRSGHD